MDLALKKYIFANPVIVKTLQSWTLEGLKRTEGAKIALTNKFHLITQCLFCAILSLVTGTCDLG